MNKIIFAALFACSALTVKAQLCSVPDTAKVRTLKVRSAKVYDATDSTRKKPAYQLTFDKRGRNIKSVDVTAGTSESFYYDDRNRITGITAKTTSGVFKSRSITSYDDRTKSVTLTGYPYATDSLRAGWRTVTDSNARVIASYNYPYSFYEYGYDNKGNRTWVKDSSRQSLQTDISVSDLLRERRVYSKDWKLIHDYYIAYDQSMMAKTITDSMTGLPIHRYIIERNANDGTAIITENGKPVSEEVKTKLNEEFGDLINPEPGIEMPPMSMEEPAPRHKLEYTKDGLLLKDTQTSGFGRYSTIKVYTYEYEYY